jgi:hypothetical protein
VTTFSQLYFDQKSEIKQFLIAFKAVLPHSTHISAISSLSVLLVMETGISGERHAGPVASHGQTLSQNIVSSTPRLSAI